MITTLFLNESKVDVRIHSLNMLCVCVGDVMDVVFSVCIVRHGAVGACVLEA